MPDLSFLDRWVNGGRRRHGWHASLRLVFLVFSGAYSGRTRAIVYNPWRATGPGPARCFDLGPEQLLIDLGKTLDGYRFGIPFTPQGESEVQEATILLLATHDQAHDHRML